MIGMNQIKKRLLVGILIGLAIGLLVVIVVIIITSNIVKGYREGTNKEYLENYTTLVTTVTRDVIQGEKITSDMLTETRVHVNMVPTNAANIAGAVGKIAKYNIPRNSTLVTSMISDSIVSVDMRIQEVNTVLLPTNLKENTYVDIRIMYPSGVEYTVLAQKQVKQIKSTTIWMDMSEEDTLLLNSAIVDSYLTEGSKLYAVEYTDPTTQIKVDDDALLAARKYIEEKIKSELELKIEEAATGDNVATGDEVTTPQANTTETVGMYVKYNSSELLDKITTYAIDYRYYVEAYNKIEANYQPNEYVMSFMRTNKYIVDQAKAKLNNDLRKGIETSIKLFENSNEDSYDAVVSGIGSSISTQQALRGNTLGE